MANNPRAHFYHHVFSSQDHPVQNPPDTGIPDPHPLGTAGVSVAEAQAGDVSSRTPVTASPEPSAVRPAGLPAAPTLTLSAPSLSAESPVDGERPAVRGWQDKGALDSAPQAFAQAAPGTEGIQRHSGKSDPSRVPTSGETRKRSARLTLRVRPGVKTALARLAEEDCLSLSATAATGLEVFVRANIHQQEEELFEPRMQAMMRREIRASDNRHIYFAMRNAIAAEQTRILTTDLYKHEFPPVVS